MEERTAPLSAVDKAEAIRHVPPSNADHPEVVWTPDSLSGGHVLWQILQQAANNTNFTALHLPLPEKQSITQ